jgi:hypothetical protein
VSRAGDGPGTAGLSDDEFDRLADFIGDALEPDDAAEVAHLIAAESRWAAAHQTLVAADASVRAELADLGQPSLTMPPDIAARLDDAFRALARTTDADDQTGFTRNPTIAVTTAEPDSPPSVAPVLSLDAARARRRRIQRICAIAAGVVAVVGGLGASINFLTTFGTAETTVADSAGGAAPDGSEALAPETPLSAGPAVFASQRDYTISTLGTVQYARTDESAQAAQSAHDGSPTTVTKDSGRPLSMADRTPDGLARLLDPIALAECLNAIRANFPGVVTTVDYARFAGKPAMVVLVQQGSGRTAVAVGPDCGRADADERASVPVR